MEHQVHGNLSRPAQIQVEAELGHRYRIENVAIEPNRWDTGVEQTVLASIPTGLEVTHARSAQIETVAIENAPTSTQNLDATVQPPLTDHDGMLNLAHCDLVKPCSLSIIANVKLTVYDAG